MAVTMTRNRARPIRHRIVPGEEPPHSSAALAQGGDQHCAAEQEDHHQQDAGGDVLAAGQHGDHDRPRQPERDDKEHGDWTTADEPTNGVGLATIIGLCVLVHGDSPRLGTGG
jgi:hypothetical protein